jgi:hypothetical protein
MNSFDPHCAICTCELHISICRDVIEIKVHEELGLETIEMNK